MIWKLKKKAWASKEKDLLNNLELLKE